MYCIQAHQKTCGKHSKKFAAHKRKISIAPFFAPCHRNITDTVPQKKLFKNLCESLLFFCEGLKIFYEALLFFCGRLKILCGGLKIFCEALQIFCGALLFFCEGLKILCEGFLFFFEAVLFFFGRRKKLWEGGCGIRKQLLSVSKRLCYVWHAYWKIWIVQPNNLKSACSK